jgi:hypothetical protein
MDIDNWPTGHMSVFMHDPEVATVHLLIWLFAGYFSMGSL